MYVRELVIERRGSMIDQVAERLCGAGLLILNPSRLIDIFLDRIETLSDALVPVEADKLVYAQVRSKAHLDQFSVPPIGDHTCYRAF
jgi:hypothetical protein